MALFEDNEFLLDINYAAIQEPVMKRLSLEETLEKLGVWLHCEALIAPKNGTYGPGGLNGGGAEDHGVV